MTFAKDTQKLKSTVCLIFIILLLSMIGLAQASSNVKIDEQNRLVVNGDLFFPVGIYLGPTGDEHLARIADAGFNTVLCYQYGSHEGSKAFLDRSEKHGLRVIYNVKNFYEHKKAYPPNKYNNNIEYTKHEYILKLKEHPALLAWYINDEEEPSNETYKRLSAMYKMIRKEDPRHPILSVTHMPYVSCFFYDSTDILAPDPYPVPEYPLTRVCEQIEQTHQGMRGEKPVWAVLQLHARKIYNKLPDFRAPTLEEKRCMTYLALIHKAQGLMFYSYQDLWRRSPEDYLTEEEFAPIWTEVSSIASEVKTLIPALLAGSDWTTTVSGGTSVEARGLSYNRELSLLITHPCRDGSQETVTIALPPGQWSIKKLLKGDVTAQVINGGTTLEVTLDPLDADTVILKMLP